MADERTQALLDIVDLARRHRLTPAEITAALDAGPAARPRSGLLVRVLGALGGTFVFAGLAIFIALQWDTLDAPARVVVTLGSGLASFALAALAARDPRFTRAASPLFLVAAALEPIGLLVLFDEYAADGDWRWGSAIACATTGAQLLLAFAVFRRSTLLFTAMLFASAVACLGLDLAGAAGPTIALVVGTSLVLAAVGLERGPHRGTTPPWYLAGSLAALYGVFDVVQDTAAEVLFLAAAAGCVYLSAALQVRTLLFVGTAAVLAYTAWFTGQHFAESLGWPLALVAFGLGLIAMSAVALRIDRRYVRPGGRSAS